MKTIFQIVPFGNGRWAAVIESGIVAVDADRSNLLERCKQSKDLLVEEEIEVQINICREDHTMEASLFYPAKFPSPDFVAVGEPVVEEVRTKRAYTRRA